MRAETAARVLGFWILMGLASCQDASLLDTNASSSKSIVVSWSVPTDSRSAAGLNPASYRVTLTSSSGAVTTQTGLQTLSVAFADPGPGVYTVKVQGLDDSGSVILEGVGSVDFSATKASVSILLAAVSTSGATGQISVSFDLSSLSYTTDPTLTLTTVSPSGTIAHPTPLSKVGGFVWSETSTEVGRWGVFAVLTWGVKTACKVASFDISSGKNIRASIVFKDADALNGFVSVASVSVPPSSSLWSGSTTTLNATVFPANASDPLIVWTSSCPSVATVSSLGVVTAVSAGNAVIRATSADNPRIFAECSVQVGYRVTYDANGGKGAAPTDTNAYPEGSTVILAQAQNLTMSGFDMAGWTTQPAESGASISAAEDGQSTLTMGHDNLVLYAVWIPSIFKWTASENSITVTGYYKAPPNAWIVPPGVTAIGDTAFANCNNLQSVALPSSVTSLGQNAFGGCPQLTALSVNPDNPNFQSIQGVVFDKTGTTLVAAPGGLGPSYVVPSGVTTIAPYAFFDCGNLKSVDLPSSLTEIGSWAFFVSVLTSVNLPAGLQTIASNAFAGSTALASVVLPDGLLTLGGNAFANCIALTSAEIPASVQSLGSYAFGGCTSLVRVDLSASTPPKVSSDSFEASAPALKIHVPSAAAVLAYRADASWGAYSKQIVTP